MEEYNYNETEKASCWYKEVCDKSRCNGFCIRHYKMDVLTHLALMEGKLKYPIKLKLDKEGTDKEPYQYLKSIQNGIKPFIEEGKNLLIYSSNTGNGKTTWAAKLMLSWFDSIWASTDLVCRGLFIPVPALLRSYVSNVTKPNEYFKYIDENILKADLVVWDELCFKDFTEFEHSYLLYVISQRISLGKANIFTTNYDLETIEKKLGTRLASRIIGGSIKVEFKGGDKRSWGV